MPRLRDVEQRVTLIDALIARAVIARRLRHYYARCDYDDIMSILRRAAYFHAYAA